MSSTHDRGRPRFVGTRIPRFEDPRFLQGRATYVDDIVVPGMVHAAFVRSPLAHARILSVDTTEAEAHPGVRAVLTGEDLRELAAPLISVMERPESVAVTRHILPFEKVRFVGEPVVAIVADSRAIAEDAAGLVDIEYEMLEHVVDASAALADGAPLLHDDVPGNNVGHITFSGGDVEAKFGAAHRVFAKRFYATRQAAAPLECHAAIADWDTYTGEVTLHASMQSPHLARGAIAHHLGIPQTHVRVVSPAVGGGFGSKNLVAVEEYALLYLSRLTRRPVKWTADRQEEFVGGTHAKEMQMELEIAVDENNRFLAFRGHYIGDGGGYGLPFVTPLMDPLHAATLLPSLYAIDACAWTVDAALTCKSWGAPYRGVGMTSGHSAREALIDEIAEELQIDPLQLRLDNCIGDAPYRSATGMSYDGGSYAATVQKARELLDYDAFRLRQPADHDAGRYRGISISPFVEPTGFGSRIARACDLRAAFFDLVSVTIEPDASVTVTTGLHSHGQGHETSIAQATADALGVNPSKIKVLYGDTARDVYGSGTYASRSAVIGGGAAMRAARAVRAKLVTLAAHKLETDESDIEICDGRVWSINDPSRETTVEVLVAAAYWGWDDRPNEEFDPGLTATRHYDPPETYSNGAIGAIVEVDVETGVVTIERIVVVEDCGQMLNPMIVDGQIAGAVAQGVGTALYEECYYDVDGQPKFATLMDFLYPSTTELPMIEIAHLTTLSPVTEGGIKGMGEGATIATPAAVLGAIHDALRAFRVKLDRTPVTPAYLLERIETARTAEQPV
jgi:CO/xanthine dehydrogenase Mo-binding subunit